MNRKLYTTLLAFCFSISSVSLLAQPMSAYTNFQDNLVVWDNGITRNIESLPPVKIAIGRNAIPYLDNSHNFKIYTKGGSKQINAGFTSNFQTSADLVLFQNAKSLNVWDNGRVTNLSKYCNQFLLGDSIVVYFDEISKEFRAYTNGGMYPMENFLAAATSQSLFGTGKGTVSTDQQVGNGQVPSIKVSGNLAAYVNYANRFKIFYHGNVSDQEDYLIENFDVGMNTVAYVDANQTFKIFHKGQTQDVEDFAPINYSAGDDLVAFVSNDYDFKIFYQDSVYNFGYMNPDYVVANNVVAFENSNGRFSVFYKGKVYEIDNYYPGNNHITIGYNSLVYVNRGNVMRMFSYGKTYDVTSANLSDWRLDYDVLQYKFGMNMYKIFYKGRQY